jgi:REP element-mobilizing transposase RayT
MLTKGSVTLLTTKRMELFARLSRMKYMARQPRVHHPEAVYHVMARGVDKCSIFLSDAERQGFLSHVKAVAAANGVRILSYCLMGNHFHLLVVVGHSPLADTMQRVLTRHSLQFNRTHGRVGHLFQSRYTAIICESERYLITLLAYIHMNPVRAGLASEPAQWPWSSHDELMTLTPRMIDLQALTDASGIGAAELQRVYVDLVGELMNKDPSPEKNLATLIERAAAIVGVSPDELSAGKQGKPYTRAKLMLIDWCRTAGIADATLARALNCSPASISLLAKRAS